MQIHVTYNRFRGFSLVEMAVVLVIMSIAITMGVAALTVQLENSSHASTLKKQEIIKDALTGYLGKYRRLPCPDLPSAVGNVVGTGDDNRTTANNTATPCSAAVGTVPYIDLGLSRDAVLDGWENFFTYAIATSNVPATDWSLTASFAPGKPGNLIVLSRDPATSATTTNMGGPENAVVVLVSHGPNGLGAWKAQGTQNVFPAAGTDEAENTNADTTFIVREPTTTNIATYGSFDDKVRFIKASELIAPLVTDGSTRTAEGETRRVLNEATEAIIGSSLATATLPATYPMPNDGWGRATVYTPIVTSKIFTNSSTTPNIAFRVNSSGPDLAVTTDDIGMSVSMDNMKLHLSRAGTLAPGAIPP